MLYANTNRQPLSQHSFAVGELSRLLFLEMTDNLPPPNMEMCVTNAGVRHDMGKVDPNFQGYINGTEEFIDPDCDNGVHPKSQKKFSFDDYPQHQEISLLIHRTLSAKFPSACNDIIEHAIFWHHAQPHRKYEKLDQWDKFSTIKQHLDEGSLGELCENAEIVMNDILAIASNYYNGSKHLISEFKVKKSDGINNAYRGVEYTPLPLHKNYPSRNSIEHHIIMAKENSINTMIRTAVILADRLVSSITNIALNRLIKERKIESHFMPLVRSKSNLCSDIQNCLDNFTSDPHRNVRQSETVKSLVDVSKYGATVLQGPAGCGKTKMFLEWAMLTNVQKLVIVVPRIDIALALNDELCSAQYLKSTSVEICTGSYQEVTQNGVTTETTEDTLFNGDIVIVNIDQLVNKITTHKRSIKVFDLVTSHVVFDEFHEYMLSDGHNLLFKELLGCCTARGGNDFDAKNINTLLVSATPNPVFVKEFLEIGDSSVIKIETFNPRKYRINIELYDEKCVDETNPFYANNDSDTLVISNDATLAQKSYMYSETTENSALYTGKLSDIDRLTQFKEIMKSHGEHGDKSFDVLRTTGILEASVNISFKRLKTMIAGIDNIFQRLGRHDRWGKNLGINEFFILAPELFESGGSECGKLLSVFGVKKSSIAFFKFISQYKGDILSLNDLYSLYDDYFSVLEHREIAAKEILASLERGVKNIEYAVQKPVHYKPKKKSKKKDTKHHVKRASLRGTSLNVNMATAYVKNGSCVSLGVEYIDDLQDDNGLTLPLRDLFDTSNKISNLPVNFMQRYHEVCTGEKLSDKTSFNKIINNARTPEKSIYASYTGNDLDNIGNSVDPLDNSVYYVFGERQPVGWMKLKKIPKKES